MLDGSGLMLRCVATLAGLLTLLAAPAAGNVNAADTTNADQLHSGGGLGLNLTGAGVTIGIWDGGAVHATHQEFQVEGGGSRVTVVGGGNNSSHATHVAGTIGATGVSPSAKGMAPGISIISYTDGHYASSME